MVKKTFGELPPEQILDNSIIPFENGSGDTKQSVSKEIANLTLHTGVIKGMQVTENGGDNTLFDVAAGSAIKVDRTDPDNVIVTQVTFSGLTGQLDTNLSESFSSVFMDPDTQVVTTEIEPPDSLSDLNNKIFLGTILHTAGVISAENDNPIIAYGSSLSELAEMVLGGGVTITGGLITANGANLKLDVALGIFQQFGRGRQFDPNNPNTEEIAAQVPVPVGSFIKMYEDAGGDLVIDASNNDMDPIQFNEDGLGTLQTVANNQFTVVRCFYAVLPGGFSRLALYYGTQEFTTITGALAAVETTFVENIDTIRLSPLAKIAIKENVTDLAAGLIAGDVVIQPILRRV